MESTIRIFKCKFCSYANETREGVVKHVTSAHVYSLFEELNIFKE